MGKMINLLNQRFGKLLVIGNAGKIDGRRYYWECLCDCGNKIVIEGSRLRSGNTKSCGCGKYDGLKKYNEIQTEQAKIPIGTKIGKLTIVEDLGLRPQTEGHSRRWYKCFCDCGEYKEVMGNFLKQGQIISCGKCLSSKGEYLICQILDELNILYNHDSLYLPLFEETGKRLRFDFIIYNKDGSINRFLEFDGRQHFYGPEASWKNSSSLEDIQKRDEIKNNFCKKHNIPLIRIPYYIKPTKEDIFSDKYLINKGDEYCD